MRAHWAWVVPLVAAMLVFSGVLLVTPPGFGTFADLLNQPRGARAEAVAYALGAAGSLALITLLVLWAACAMLDALVRRRGP
jgi:hypothetical protein